MNFEDLQYQRLVIGYHGCDESVRDRVILRKQKLKPSENDYDWLGRGIYFWEHGPERAMQWARSQVKKGSYERPAVLGAVIHLGRCFDLLDTRYTHILGDNHEGFCEHLNKAGQRIPENSGGQDLLVRKLDCAMINWTLSASKAVGGPVFQSVRGVFQEGGTAYEGSSIHKKSHIQIAIRDEACIMGYFIPD